MDKTPKKIVRSELLCFLCGCTLTKERLRILGKSFVHIQGVIKVAIDMGVTVFRQVSLHFELLQRLIRFEKISINLISLRGDIKRDNEQGGLRSK